MQAVSTTRSGTKRFIETLFIVILGTILPSGLGGLSHLNHGDPSLGTILVMGIFILLHQFSQMYLVPNFKKEVVKNVYRSKDPNGNINVYILLESLFIFFDQGVENSEPKNEGEKQNLRKIAKDSVTNSKSHYPPFLSFQTFYNTRTRKKSSSN